MEITKDTHAADIFKEYGDIANPDIQSWVSARDNFSTPLIRLLGDDTPPTLVVI